MAEKLGGRISYNMVVQSLLTDHFDLENVKGEIQLLKDEMEDSDFSN